MKLHETDIYLSTLSREDCKTLWNDFEYDFDNPTEELNLEHSDEKANDWLTKYKSYRETDTSGWGFSRMTEP